MTSTEHQKYFNFELTPLQAEAFDRISHFIEQDITRIFILKGYAGTGKTTLMSGLISLLNEKEIKYNLLASTGRAAKVLGDKTGTEASTVHHLIYKYESLSHDLEKMSEQSLQNENLTLKFSLSTPIHTEAVIYIVDEASMLADAVDKSTSFARFNEGNLLADLFNYHPEGKFIFVGDPCQLPPVNQRISPALSAGHIESKYQYKCESYELNEIVRQKGQNGIIAASLTLRRQYTTPETAKWASLYLRGYKNITLHPGKENLISKYIAKIKQHGNNHATLLCQTNAHCNVINTTVRCALKKDPVQPEIGDLLLITQNNFPTGLVNGDLVEIIKIGNSRRHCSLTFREIKLRETVTGKTYTSLLVEEVLTSKSTNLTPEQNKQLLIDFSRRMSDKGIGQKHPFFAEYMRNDPYLNALKAVYGYALTCHKSQGGEWPEVYLYLDNKIQGMPRPEIYQWWYTAVTRAQQQLHVAEDWFVK